MNATIAIVGIFLYPLGIPLFFYKKLREYVSGKTGANRLDQKGVRCQIGFIYDGFDRRVWYFELIDMLHKMVCTSLVPFFPLVAQLPMVMVFMVFFLIIILVLNPYIRKGDDRLHLIAQTELIMIMMAGNVFRQEQPDALIDLILSIVLIGFVCVFFIGWCVSMFGIAKKAIKQEDHPVAVSCRKCFKIKYVDPSKVSLADDTDTHHHDGVTEVANNRRIRFKQHRREITSNRKRAVLLAQGKSKQAQVEMAMFTNPMKLKEVAQIQEVLNAAEKEKQAEAEAARAAEEERLAREKAEAEEKARQDELEKKKNTKCEGCEEVLATIECPDCEALYCAECDGNSHKNKRMAKHVRSQL
jgi:hypothetical protein